MRFTEFRALRADEIECRISTINEKGLSLLLYKDARVDMRLLDETVGSMNWKRSHQVIDGNLYCTIEVWDADKEQWISKQDVGTESYTEKEKGQASDSFKRAGFNFGIGRELYTAPFIWVPASECTIKQNGNKFVCYDRFAVWSITTNDGNIVGLEIGNEKTGKTVYKMECGGKIGGVKAKALEDLLNQANVNVARLLDQYGVKGLSDLTEKQHLEIVNAANRAMKK